MFNRRNALIGYMVSKVVLPLAMRRMRSRVTGAAGSVARGSSGTRGGGKAKKSVALGAAVGAAGYVLSRRRGGSEAGTTAGDDSAATGPGSNA